jgi:hypothetical protein
MSSAHYAGSLPVVSPTTVENDRFADGQPSSRKRTSRTFFRFLVAFCTGVAATLAWWSSGDAARRMIANWYLQLGWLAPQAEPVAQSAPDITALVAPSTPSFDQDQLTATALNLDAVRQSIDRIAAGQEEMTRSIDQIASSIAAGQEQMARSIDQIASSIAASQEQMKRSTDQTATSIGASQEQMTRSTDQTATSIGQGPSAKVGGVAVGSRDGAASLQPVARLNIKPTEAKPSEKPLSAVSAHDPTCFPSALAVLQNHPGSSPSWTLRAPGHEGTKCWRAATRTRESDQTGASDQPTKHR